MAEADEVHVLAHIEDGKYVCDLCGERDIPIVEPTGHAEWLEHFRLFHPDDFERAFPS